LRHAALAAVYLGLAYAAKLAFGVSLVFNAIRLGRLTKKL
jgi:hypothetical protein